MLNPAPRVLVVEDEADLAELITLNLRQNGFDASAVTTGTDAINLLIPLLDQLHEAGSCPALPEVVLLDLMLPGVRGEDILRRIRAHVVGHRLPVIVLTAKGSDHDQIVGLDLGADDYLSKPASTEILIARIRALLRRTRHESEPNHVLREGPIEINQDIHEVTVHGAQIKLTLTEFRLLTSLMEAHGKVMSRADLMTRAMGPGITVTERTIDVHITSIRKKLGTAAEAIKTVRGVGYRFMTPQSTDTAGSDSSSHA
jgi:DNA-binding response OmpR family regulator